MAKRTKKTRRTETKKPKGHKSAQKMTSERVSAREKTESVSSEPKSRPTIPDAAMTWISAPAPAAQNPSVEADLPAKVDSEIIEPTKSEGLAPVKDRPEPTEVRAEDKSVAMQDVDEAFFQQGEELAHAHEKERQDSLPPVAGDISASRWDKGAPPPPEVAVRRAKLRKVVATVVGFAAMIVVGGVGKSLTANEPEGAISTAHAGAPTEVVSPVNDTVSEAEQTAAPAPKAEAAAPEAEKVEAQPESEKPAPDQADVPADVDVKKKALALLNRGRMKEAIPMARAAVARDPDDALGYLYLGTALQMSGSRSEATDAYSQCVRTAKESGPVNECRAMGGRK